MYPTNTLGYIINTDNTVPEKLKKKNQQVFTFKMQYFVTFKDSEDLFSSIKMFLKVTIYSFF